MKIRRQRGKNRPALERFMDLILKNAGTGCWEWNSGKDASGYGMFHFNSRCHRAHRASWILHKGPIPVGMIVCHKCDNTKCVNPDHLFIGTYKDNMDDCVNKGRSSLMFLTADVVLKIRADQRHYSEISEAFGITKRYVYMIKNREIWKSI